MILRTAATEWRLTYLSIFLSIYTQKRSFQPWLPLDDPELTAGRLVPLWTWLSPLVFPKSSLVDSVVPPGLDMKTLAASSLNLEASFIKNANI